MAVTRWGIIGPGDIAHNFADGLKETDTGKLIAIASRDAARRKAFGDQYSVAADKRYSTYEALAADPEIDAIYVSTPHPWHAELSIMAMRHGKALVCEKPMGMNAGEAAAVTEAAVQAGVFFMEAFMYRCHPQIARLVEIIKSGEIGAVRHIKATFGFSSQRNPASRLYDPMLGGGGILDVGCYPVSASRLIAGAAIGAGFDNPTQVKGVAVMGPTGVDETAFGLLTFKSGITAEIACSVQNEMENAVIVFGEKGSIRLGNPWVPGRNAGPSDATIEVTSGGNSRVEDVKSHHHLFAFEADLASRLIAEGKKQAVSPAMSHGDSVGNAETLDRWRQEVGYVTFAEKPKSRRRTAGFPELFHPAFPPFPRSSLTASSCLYRASPSAATTRMTSAPALLSGTHLWKLAAMRLTPALSMAAGTMKWCWVNGSPRATSKRTSMSSSKARTRPTAPPAPSRRSSTFR